MAVPMRPLRVITYNVRYFGHSTRGLASTATSMGRIASALAALDPLADLICLQEVETASIRSNVVHRSSRGDTQLARLMSMLHRALVGFGKRDTYQAHYFPAHTYRVALTPVYTTGLAVITGQGLEVLRHNSAQPHDITYGRGSSDIRMPQTRICAHLRVVHPTGVELDIFNTHLSLPTTFSREFWLNPRRMGWGPNQLEEAKNLVQYVSDEQAGECWLLVGDFNALPGSPVYLHLLDAGFVDPFASYFCFDEASLLRWPTAGFMKMRMHLDHVFCGKGLRFLDFEGTHRFGQSGGAFRGLSDHVPVVGSFAFA